MTLYLYSILFLLTLSIQAPPAARGWRSVYVGELHQQLKIGVQGSRGDSLEVPARAQLRLTIWRQGDYSWVQIELGEVVFAYLPSRQESVPLGSEAIIDWQQRIFCELDGARQIRELYKLAPMPLSTPLEDSVWVAGYLCQAWQDTAHGITVWCSPRLPAALTTSPFPPYWMDSPKGGGIVRMRSPSLDLTLESYGEASFDLDVFTWPVADPDTLPVFRWDGL